MTHDHHAGLPGYDEEAVLTDGCAECEERSRAGLEGLLALDRHNVNRLWLRCLDTELGRGSDKYRSHCEARLGHQLYLVGVFLQGYEDVWRADRFPVPS